MTQLPEWIDSHCHLEMLKRETNSILEECVHKGTKTCITIGTNHKSNQETLKYCHSFANVFATVGFHPHNASSFNQKHIDWIREAAMNNKKIVGIGECGFDLYYKKSPKKAQFKTFVSQLDLAVELELPVVIHSREADSETREALKEYRNKNLTGVVHCFTSNRNQAKYLLDSGFYLSFNGISTYTTANQVRDVLKYIPLDRILLETDAPFLSPESLKGKPNNPGNIPVIGEYIAHFLKIPTSEFAEITSKNTHNLFLKMSYES